MGYPFGREVGTKGTATVSGGLRVGGGNGTATRGGFVAGVVPAVAGGVVTSVRTRARVTGVRVCTTAGGLVDDVVTGVVVGVTRGRVVTVVRFFVGATTRVRDAAACRDCSCEIGLPSPGVSFVLLDDERVRIATRTNSATMHITAPANACGVCPRRRSSSCSKSIASSALSGFFTVGSSWAVGP
jgi:hypothetical protein